MAGFHLADLFEIVARAVPQRSAIVCDGLAEPSLDEVRAFLAGRLGGYKLPRALVWVDTVERSPAGKQDYRWAKTVAAGAT